MSRSAKRAMSNLSSPEKTGFEASGAKRAAREELRACRKKLGIMNIEIGIYREIGGLVVKGAPRAFLLNRLMDFALKALETDSGTLYLLDEAANELTFEVVKGPLAQKFRGLKMRSQSGIAGLVARTGRHYLSQDVMRDKVWAGIKAGRAANILAVPLMRKKRVLGVIEVINKTDGNPFTRADLKVLQSLANHFSIIMERAKLFSELDGRIKQLSTLNQVGNLLISTLDQTVVRHRAMEAVTKLMRAETGSLLLLDAADGKLYFEVALGKQGKKLKKIRLDIGEGIAGWVAMHGKPLIIPDVTKDKRFQKKVDKSSKFRTRDMVCVPVKIKGKVIGVLQAINRIGGEPFKKADLELFQLFSNQAAIALDNARLYEEIRDAFYATSGALAEAIEKRDPYTGGHTKRVLEYCLAIAGELKLKPGDLEVLKLSAVLHDIGKIGIEDRILKKDAPLNSEEAASMRTHPQCGAEILKHVPQMKDIVPGMLHHHERVDGLGYPCGYKNSEIPLTAKIISVADTYDAMTTTRPYRKGLASGLALKELRRFSGRQFDPKVVNAFMKAFRKGVIARIKKSCRKGMPGYNTARTL